MPNKEINQNFSDLYQAKPDTMGRYWVQNKITGHIFIILSHDHIKAFATMITYIYK